MEEMRKEDVIILNNLGPSHIHNFDRFIFDVAVMMKAELKLRGVFQPKIHLIRKMTPEELEKGKVELVVRIERPWPNKIWHDFAIHLHKALQYKFKGSNLTVARINFRGEQEAS